MPLIVGAYPVYNSMPNRRDLLDLLADDPLIGGLEVPFEDGEIPIPAGTPSHWTHVVTMIPGTVAACRADPTFGLASPHEDGRRAAIAQVRELHQQVVLGDHRILAVELHSAPPRIGTSEALARSLTEIAGWDWGETQVCVEHCDAWTDSHPVEKGFLALAGELDAVAESGLSMTLNWARSVIEARDPAAGLGHIREAAGRGLLAGVMFSSVSDRANPQGPAWLDAHLAPRELLAQGSGSLLDAAAIGACLAAAGSAWRGFKIGAPAGFSVTESARFLRQTAELIDREAARLAATSPGPRR